MSKITIPVALCCDNIGDLDNGIARHLINAAITEALNDLADRGEEDKKPRGVIIKLQFAHHQGLVVVDIQARSETPPRRSRLTAAQLRMKGKGVHEILFQPTNSDNPAQGTLADGEVPMDETDE